MNVLIISGAEATCKSDIAKRIAQETHSRYLSKDVIKEAMFDSLGDEHSTWDYLWYEIKAKDQFFKELKTIVAHNDDVIIETNFKGNDKKKLQAVLGQVTTIKEVHCSTRGLISFKRAVRRNESGRRHPGHHDRRWYPKVLIQSLLRMVGIHIGAHRAVGLSPDVLLLDTSSYPDIDFNSVMRFVEGARTVPIAS